MAECRFCGALLEQTVLPCDCRLCGRRNDPEFAPVKLDWSGGGFVWSSTDLRLPFASNILVAPGQRALLRLDGRNEVLKEGRHPVYPADPDSAQVAFFSVEWHPLEGTLTHILPWPQARWELRVAFALEARTTGPEAFADMGPFDADLNQRITATLQDTVATAVAEAMSGLEPREGEGRDALAVRVDAALSALDRSALGRRLAEKGRLEARDISVWRTTLAAEDANGEPCPACRRLNHRADGLNTTCGFCGTRLFWCPNCLKHVVRSDDRWCPSCRGRLYA